MNTLTFLPGRQRENKLSVKHFPVSSPPLCVSPKNILFHATVPLKSSDGKPNTTVKIREKMCVLSCKAQNHFEE